MGCSFTSQQYYQQQYTMMQGISGAPGVSGNAQAPFDPFVMNQQQMSNHQVLQNRLQSLLAQCRFTNASISRSYQQKCEECRSLQEQTQSFEATRLQLQTEVRVGKQSVDRRSIRCRTSWKSRDRASKPRSKPPPKPTKSAFC